MKTQFSFIIFSDLHIGGKFSEEMFNKGVEIINNSDADYYICAGDVTDNGTVAEYELATKKYLPRIKKKVLMVPGNHDEKNVGDILWEEYIGPRYFVINNEERKIRILGLDSNEPDRNTGRIGKRGINRIYQEFQECHDDWLKVIVFHHQTLPIKYTGRERSALIDAGDTIKAIMDCNIDLVVNGHRHISNVFEMTDGDITTLIVNSGTISCKKTRYREEYSLTKVCFDKEQIRASVEVMKLKAEKPVWESKFQGSIKQPPLPEKPDRLLKTIVQIGNTDFSDGMYNMDNLVAAVKLINSMNCDLVIHTGDITGHSYKSEFDLASKMLELIEPEKMVIPGPKDSYPLGFELYEQFFGTANPTYEDDNIIVLGFDSCVLDEKIGRLGRSRRTEFVEKLHNNEKVKIIAFHHSIIPLPRSKHESELQDAGDVLATIVEHDIDLVLTGAKNRAGCWQVNNTVFVNSGTLSSKNIVTIKGNSFNIIQIYKTDIGIYFKIDEYFIESGEIVPLGRLHLKEK